MGRALGKDLETNQPGGTGKVGDGNSGYEDKGTFRRDPEWILLQFKCRVVTSESGLKSFEFMVENVMSKPGRCSCLPFRLRPRRMSVPGT